MEIYSIRTVFSMWHWFEINYRAYVTKWNSAGQLSSVFNGFWAVFNQSAQMGLVSKTCLLLFSPWYVKLITLSITSCLFSLGDVTLMKAWQEGSQERFLFFPRGWGFSSAQCSSLGIGKYQDPVFQTVAPDGCNSLSFIYETSDCLPLTCSTCSRRLMYPVVHSELYCRALLLSSSLTSGWKAACWKKKKRRDKKNDSHWQIKIQHRFWYKSEKFLWNLEWLYYYVVYCEQQIEPLLEFTDC